MITKLLLICISIIKRKYKKDTKVQGKLKKRGIPQILK